MRPKRTQMWLGPLRLPFLILAPICVLSGVSVCVYRNIRMEWLPTFFAFLGGLAAHIAVNTLNEYEDFRSGLDFETEQTPFSGGSKTLPQMPEAAPYALWEGIAAIAVTVLIGVYFWRLRGWPMVLIGACGILLILLYTRFLTRSAFLCLIAPGLGFGPLMVLGTEYALSGTVSSTGMLASVIPFFLVNNLLLLNQYPDQLADTTFGRRHFIIRFGRKNGLIVFTSFLLATYVTLAAAIIAGEFPFPTLLGMLGLVWAVPLLRNIRKMIEQSPLMIPLLAKNVMVALITPFCTGIGFLIAKLM